MPSLIQGYNYDIFISYRHHDNLDGWVTEFVHALEKELKGTIKDPVSVYFDTNPHDGLLETHHVDKSLEGKLKCLIFIPIISQTYCDPKSFAWQQEFCAFNKRVSSPQPDEQGMTTDLFGRDIRVGSGNVASRILSVNIHDLDPEDKAILEKELGTVFRAVEFIYKESGVNRPLKRDDSETKNQNGTRYLNQVNKVANAVKELINGLKNFDKPSSGHPPTISPMAPRPRPRARRILSNSSAILLILLLAGYFVFNHTNISDSLRPAAIDKSIAVLPFENMSGDPEQEYFSDGITEEILNSLAQLEGLKVAGRTSSFQFKGKSPDLKEVGEKLSVSTILEGSVRKQGDQLRITVQLINAKDGYHLWSQRFDRKVTDIFAIQDEIAQAVSSRMKVTLLDQPAERSGPNQAAYDLYLKGRYFLAKRGDGIATGLGYFRQSLALDSTFAQTYSSIAFCHALLAYYYILPSQGEVSEFKKFVEKALALDPNSSDAWTVMGFACLEHGERMGQGR